MGTSRRGAHPGSAGAPPQRRCVFVAHWCSRPRPVSRTLRAPVWSDFYSLSNAVQALLAGGLAGVLVGQYRVYKRPALRLWALGWAASALGLLAGAISARLWAHLEMGSGEARVLLAITGAGAALQAGALLAGSLIHTGNPVSRRAIWLGLSGCAAAGAILSLGLPGTLLGNARASLLPLFTFFAFIWSAQLLWSG